jgi:hypothetical protein
MNLRTAQVRLVGWQMNGFERKRPWPNRGAIPGLSKIPVRMDAVAVQIPT